MAVNRAFILAREAAHAIFLFQPGRRPYWSCTCSFTAGKPTSTVATHRKCARHKLSMQCILHDECTIANGMCPNIRKVGHDKDGCHHQM